MSAADLSDLVSLTGVDDRGESYETLVRRSAVTIICDSGGERSRLWAGGRCVDVEAPVREVAERLGLTVAAAS